MVSSITLFLLFVPIPQAALHSVNDDQGTHPLINEKFYRKGVF